ncbi:MAG: hypothetical protein KDD70_15780, partial [Bdellovibrionales bacterium]|nr:hypothetical protein [Bdellovibrionales bacterium]
MSDPVVSNARRSPADPTESSSQHTTIHTQMFEAVRSELMARSTVAAERLLISAELHERADALPGFREGLQQKLLHGDIAEESGPLVVERYFAAFTR